MTAGVRRGRPGGEGVRVGCDGEGDSEGEHVDVRARELAEWACGPQGMDRLRERVAELEELVRRLSERVYLQSELLGRRAERKEARNQ